MDGFVFVVSIFFGIVLASLLLLSFVMPYLAVPLLIAVILIPLVYFYYFRKPHSTDRTP